jgi:hypothetical protein
MSRKMSFGRLLLGWAAALLLIAGTATAQTTTGSIQGAVKDGTGAVLPGATVTATNVDTGFARSTTTDGDGAYALRLLPLGQYKIEATLASFKTFVQSGLSVEVGRTLRVDPTLELGGLTDVVEAVAQAPLVETTSAALGRVITNEEVQNLPLVNRNAYQLLNLTAGVDRSESVPTFGYTAQETIVNGSPNGGAGAVNYYLDGGGNVGGLRNTGNLIPNPDAIQEFRVVTNSFSAEYGKFAGGAVDIVTKSGTNTFHGSVFDYFRNDKISEKRWTPTTSAALDPLDRHQFGGTLGGPIAHDRTFFFASYSGLRQESSRFRNTAIVPTALERNGNFSALLVADPARGRPFPIFVKDPAATLPCVSPTAVNRDGDNRGCFPGNIVPSSRFDPTAVNILKRIPLPNLNGTTGNYEVTRPLNTNRDEGQFKLDHALSGSHQLSASYFYSREESNNPLQGTIPWADQLGGSKQHNVNLADNWTVGPSAINTFRVTYVRQFGFRNNISDETIPEIQLKDFGSRFTIQGAEALPAINVTGYFNAATAIWGPTAGSNMYSVRDTLNLSKGRHSLKIGAEISLEKMIQDTTLNNYGTFAFTNAKTNNGFADFLLGLPNTMNQDAPVVKYDDVWYGALFLQDDFRLSSRITLNLGLRYDVQSSPTDVYDRKLTFVQGAQSTIAPSAPQGLLFPGDNGPNGKIPRGIVGADMNNFSPRVGIAWDATGDGRTAVRVGGGIFYGTVSGNEWNQTADNQPFSIRQQFNNVFSLTDPYRSLPGGVSPYPFTYNPSSPTFTSNAAIYGIHSDFVLPHTYQMNVSVQRQITNSLSLGVAYVGAMGRGYGIAPDINYPLPSATASTANVDARRPILQGQNKYSRINLLQSIGESDYHGVQTTFEKRGKHLTLKGYYSFGKALESVSLGEGVVQGSGTTSPAQNSSRLGAERARTGTDRRHNFVTSMIWKIDYFGNSNAIVRTLFNNWTLSAIGTVRSGTGLTISAGTDRNVDGVNNDRANVVGDFKLDSGRSRDANDPNSAINMWFNTAAFAIPAQGTDGNSQRRLVDNPGLKTVDLGLFRDFRFGRAALQVRAEATNVLNTVNLSAPAASMAAPATFGKISGAGNMREVQLGAKISF